jgi:hypothetical protein
MALRIAALEWPYNTPVSMTIEGLPPSFRHRESYASGLAFSTKTESLRGQLA